MTDQMLSTDESQLALLDTPSGDRDNITDWCLEQFQSHYQNPSITKDDIWEYLYGVMHAPDWRERYKHDLQRNLPRVPFAPDFEAFRKAGRELIDLHIGYETCDEYPLECILDDRPIEADIPGSSDSGALRITVLRWGRSPDGKRNDKSVLEINDRCKLVDIPAAAHEYQVSGRSPLEWAVASLRVKHDKDSGIVDDPNGWHVWADDPYELIRHLRRLAHIGVRSSEIIAGLPPALSDELATPLGALA